MSGKMRKTAFCLAAAALALVWLTAPAAAEKPWWPFPVVEFSTGKAKVVDYVPLEKASKKWNIVALFPHMKDTSWRGANYGLIMEARRLGVKLTILEAGGYDNLNKQLSQYDDALAMGADAILTGVISEVGLSKKFQEGKDKGVINVSVINPVYKAPVDASVYNDVPFMARSAADVVVETFKDKDKVRAVILPGPAGSGWAEDMAKGFREQLEAKAAGRFEVLDEKYGDAGKSVQLKLVEDVLQTYDKVDVLYGCNPMAEVAVNVVEDMGLTGKTRIMASYESKDLLPVIEAGKIIGMVGEYNVAISRICLDLAVRLLEKKPTGFSAHLQPLVQAITKDSLQKIQRDWAFAPDDYHPVYKVE